MAIDFRCTNCGKLLRTGDDTAGKRAKCPDCGTVLTIPAAGAPVPMPGGAIPGGAVPSGAVPPMPQPGVNPFQSPQAGAGPRANYASTAPAGKLDMNDLLGTTWAVFKANMGTAVLLLLVINVIVMVAFGVVWGVAMLFAEMLGEGIGVFLAMVGYIVVVALFAALMVGALKGLMKLARGQPVSVGELFAFGPELGPFVLTYLLFTVIVSIGNMLCVVPGIFLATMFSQAIFLVVDRNVAVMDSFNQSKDLTNGNKMTIFVTYLVAFLGAMVVSMLTCGIGSLFATPFLWLLGVVMYLRITGQPIVAPVK
jgi:hypothetical protein